MSNLFIREVEPHEIETENPDAQRLVMTSEEGPGQIVEAFPTGVALIFLPCGLGLVPSLFGHPRRMAMRAVDPFRPAHLANRLEALDIVDEVLDVDHHPCSHTTLEEGTQPMKPLSAIGTRF